MKSLLTFQLALLFLSLFTDCYAEEKVDKRALIIGVSSYQHETKWQNLSTSQDVELITKSLQKRGFDKHNIITLTENTNKIDILNAFRTELIDKAEKGGIYFFHFSGHGYQIPDDNGDEMDGWDETIVPSDAPFDFKKNNEKSFYKNYIRDDELMLLLEELRKKVGPTGSVLVTLDSCHSGTATRGGSVCRGDFRGRNDKKGTNNSDNGRFGLTSNTNEMASLTCFFASSEFQLNNEYHENGYDCGSLSYAFSKALNEAHSYSSYLSVFDRVKVIMNEIVPGQTPVLEGSSNQSLFGTETHDIDPFFKVTEIVTDSTVKLDAGNLSSIKEGTIIGFYNPKKVTEEREKTPFITGTVINSQFTSATIQFEKKINDTEKLKQAWGYILSSQINESKLKIKIVTKNKKLRKSIESELNKLGFVSYSDTLKSFDMLLEVGVFKGELSDSLYLTNKQDLICLNLPLTHKKNIDQKTLDEINETVVGYNQVCNIRELEHYNSDFKITLELVPYRLKKDSIGNDYRHYELMDSIQPTAWPLGSYFGFRIKNTGKKTAFFNIIDITPLNQIFLLAPNGNQSAQELKLEANQEILLESVFRAGAPTGFDLLKVIVSANPVEMNGILLTKRDAIPSLRARRGARGFDPIEELFYSTLNPSRAGEDMTNIDRENIGIYSVIYEIIENTP